MKKDIKKDKNTKKVVWLFGENDSRTMNNNSYYFFKHVCDLEDEIEKYYILEKNSKNAKLIKEMPFNIKSKIIWKNSIKHWKVYLNSDLHLVTLSCRDVTPSKLLFKNIKMRVKKPIIYLQHGTIAMKKLGYHGRSYNNNMFRFFVYNEKVLKQLEEENQFKPYQLYYAKYHPRYMELIKKNEELNKNQILYFLTWREYLGDNKETKKLLTIIENLISNKELISYLEKNKTTFKLCLHQFFDEEVLSDINKKINKEIFEIVTPSKINVMDELAQSKLLITDYSSVGFDFTFLNKPVILFTPDIKEYLTERDMYCKIEELEKYAIKDVKILVETITNNRYQINEFFRSRLPEKIDHEYIKNGHHITDMYNYLKEKSLNKISFIGYKFGGSGGTVSATKSLAEKLMERGYLVELVSLNGTTKNRTEFPEGINEIKLTRRNNQFYTKFYENFLRKIPKKKQFMGDIKHDHSYQHLVINIGKRINKFLEKTNSKTVISTRESLHPYLSKAVNNKIKNKVYFFHTDANAFEKFFSNLKPTLEKYEYDKCVFVSESNYQKYRKKFNLKMNKHIVIGNTIESNRIIPKNEIKVPNKKQVYTGIVLARLSDDRIFDINNIISFGKLLKSKNIKNIKINVFGKGHQAKYLENEIKENEIEDFIVYQGHTSNPTEEIQRNDFLIDFSENQSFGMIYIEGILAGKKVYATKNDGSKEVLEGISDSIYNNHEQLLKYLKNFDKITLEELQKNYEIIINKYGNDIIVEKFINYLDD